MYKSLSSDAVIFQSRQNKVTYCKTLWKDQGSRYPNLLRNQPGRSVETRSGGMVSTTRVSVKNYLKDLRFEIKSRTKGPEC